MPSRALIIDIDSLRPDHVGAYGHVNETTPTIDKIAADGIRFTRAYATNTPCMPSRAGLLTGRHGINNGIETHGAGAQTLNSPDTWSVERRLASDSDEWRTLPQLTFANRINTFGVSSFPRHPAPWFHRTWHEFHIPQEPPGNRETFATPRAENIVDCVIETIEGHDDFFGYAQFWEPHVPYRSDGVDSFADSIEAHPYPTAEQIDEHADWNAPRTPDSVGISDRADLADQLAAYDAEIRSVDEELDRLIAHLKSRDLYDEMLIVVMADHGEEFGSHGIYKHHGTVYEGTQHIPLIIKPPADAQVHGTASEALVRNIDVPATVLDYLGIDRPGKWHGDTLRPVIEGEGSLRDCLLLEHGLYTAQRALRTDEWKLVKTLHSGAWEYPQLQLFNIEEDPWEQSDLSDDNPALVDSLHQRLCQRRDELIDDSQDDPLAEVAESGPEGYRFWTEWQSDSQT